MKAVSLFHVPWFEESTYLWNWSKDTPDHHETGEDLDEREEGARGDEAHQTMNNLHQGQRLEDRRRQGYMGP